MPSGDAWVLLLEEWLDNPVQQGRCEVWTDNYGVLYGRVSSAHGIVRGTIPMFLNNVHTHYGLQAHTLSNSVFSNGIRVTIGGSL